MRSKAPHNLLHFKYEEMKLTFYNRINNKVLMKFGFIIIIAFYIGFRFGKSKGERDRLLNVNEKLKKNYVKFKSR